VGRRRESFPIGDLNPPGKHGHLTTVVVCVISGTMLELRLNQLCWLPASGIRMELVSSSYGSASPLCSVIELDRSLFWV